MSLTFQRHWVLGQGWKALFLTRLAKGQRVQEDNRAAAQLARRDFQGGVLKGDGLEWNLGFGGLTESGDDGASDLFHSSHGKVLGQCGHKDPAFPIDGERAGGQPGQSGFRLAFAYEA